MGREVPRKRAVRTLVVAWITTRMAGVNRRESSCHHLSGHTPPTGTLFKPPSHPRLPLGWETLSGPTSPGFSPSTRPSPFPSLFRRGLPPHSEFRLSPPSSPPRLPLGWELLLQAATPVSGFSHTPGPCAPGPRSIPGPNSPLAGPSRAVSPGVPCHGRSVLRLFLKSLSLDMIQ